MLRVALLGIVTIACACHGKDDARQTETGSAGVASGLVDSAAGTVLEKAGTVTVADKPLAVGDHVAAGDVVTTGDASRVVIQLSHNSAKWELGPNRAVRVADSIVWKMAPAQAAMGVVRDMAQPNVPSSGLPAPPQQTTPQGAAAVLMYHRGALMRCLDAATETTQLMVHVDAHGKASTEVPGANAAVRTCLTSEVDKLKFPAQEAGVGITLKK